MSSPKSNPSEEFNNAKHSDERASSSYNSIVQINLTQYDDKLPLEEIKLEEIIKILDINKTSDSVNDKSLAETLASSLLENGNLLTSINIDKLASLCYRKGLDLEFSNDKLRFELYCKLSESLFILKEYSSCLETIEQMLKIVPGYKIGLSRAVRCSILLRDYYKSLMYYTNYAKQLDNKNKEDVLQVHEYYEAVKQLQLLNVLNQRKITVTVPKNNSDVFDDMKLFDTKFVCLNPVHLIYTRLVWPVIFNCPQYDYTLLVHNFHEDTKFCTKLIEQFTVKRTWDIKGEYTPDNINIYYLNRYEPIPKLHKVDKTYSLLDALTLLKCPIEYGSPVFTIFASGVPDEKEALRDYTGYMRKKIDE